MIKEKLIKIEPIAVKDKYDVVKALTILEKIGIEIMSDEKKKNYFLDETKTVDNNFMIQEDDGGFRIQSHYIGSGISLESLDKQVNDIIEKHPNLCERLKEIENKESELRKEINNMNNIIDDSKKSLPIITLKENY
jgi:hypothetical protein